MPTLLAVSLALCLTTGGFNRQPADLANRAEVGRPRAVGLPPRARHVAGPLKRGVHELKDPSSWPPEPPAPTDPVDAPRFDRAVTSLCRSVAPRTVNLAEVAAAIREVARETDSDAFLLAALGYRQGLCNPTHESTTGLGFLQIQPDMFAMAATLPFPRKDLDRKRLLDLRHNLRVGAALLRLWRDEHLRLDARYGGTPHRSAVAHFIWGDRVWGAAGEDRVFTARRRLLESYGTYAPGAHPSWFGFPLVAPLEGAPRLGTSGPGADRDGGAREHRGLDIDASVGEPVRAVADGVVQFAGADMPGRQPGKWLTPNGSRKYRGRFGPGGIFVRINHQQSVRTGYFHLSSFSVTAGQVVKAGEVIGWVGRTGIRVSSSHLHLEVMQDGQLLDPVRFMSAFVLPPQATLTHELAMNEKKVRLDRAKRAARRSRLQARHRTPTS